MKEDTNFLEGLKAAIDNFTKIAFFQEKAHDLIKSMASDGFEKREPELYENTARICDELQETDRILEKQIADLQKTRKDIKGALDGFNRIRRLRSKLNSVRDDATL